MARPVSSHEMNRSEMNHRCTEPTEDGFGGKRGWPHRRGFDHCLFLMSSTPSSDSDSYSVLSAPLWFVLLGVAPLGGNRISVSDRSRMPESVPGPFSEAYALDPIDQALDLEIDEQSTFEPGQLQIGKDLCCVYREKRIDGFQLDDDFATHEEVEPELVE